MGRPRRRGEGNIRWDTAENGVPVLAAVAPKVGDVQLGAHSRTCELECEIDPAWLETLTFSGY